MSTAILTETGFLVVQPFNPNELPSSLADKLRAAHRAVVRMGDIAAAHGNQGRYAARWYELLDVRDDLVSDLLSLGGYSREAVRAVVPSIMA